MAVQEIKPRKPYRMTKQREKWTDKEHQKFLEALKLYGRAWRRIQEHIATKTAIQIRSHAQKFFSKVARISCSVSDTSTTHISIDIPPPRPKKKPLHPYPRKVADLFMKRSGVSDQPDTSLSKDLSTRDADNLSPTSILPTLGSDPISPTPAASELNSHCHSPISCTSNPPSEDTFFMEKDLECMTFISGAIEKGSPSSVGVTTGSVPEHLTPSSSIKLFGKMVLITDSRKTSTLTEECNVFFFNRSTEDKFGDQNHKLLEALPTENMECRVSCEMLYSSTQNSENLIETKGNLHEDKSHENGVLRTQSWWTSCEKLPLQAALDLSKEQRLVDDEQEYRAYSCLSNGSVDELYGTQMYPGPNKSQNRTSIQLRGKAKGFVPYKRCAEERDTMSLVNVFEESEAKKICACS